MSVVNDDEFNCVFLSYSREDKIFAGKFRDSLQEKLDRRLGVSEVVVWMDERLGKGKDWRGEIQRKLNLASLVVVLLSPDSAKSPWVVYEWNSSLLVQQTTPYLVHYRECGEKELRRFSDYQYDVEPFAPHLPIKQLDEVEQLWDKKKTEIDETLEDIAKILKNFSMLEGQYRILTKVGEFPGVQQQAAYELSSVHDGLRLAAANYLIEALQFWLSNERFYGYVGASIASALSRLGKKKAIPVLARLVVNQAGQDDVLAVVVQAISSLSCEESV